MYGISILNEESLVATVLTTNIFFPFVISSKLAFSVGFLSNLLLMYATKETQFSQWCCGFLGEEK